MCLCFLEQVRWVILWLDLTAVDLDISRMLHGLTGSHARYPAEGVPPLKCSHTLFLLVQSYPLKSSKEFLRLPEHNEDTIEEGGGIPWRILSTKWVQLYQHSWRTVSPVKVVSYVTINEYFIKIKETENDVPTFRFLNLYMHPIVCPTK